MADILTLKGARAEHELADQKRQDISRSIYFLQQDIQNDSSRRQAGLRCQ